MAPLTDCPKDKPVLARPLQAAHSGGNPAAAERFLPRSQSRRRFRTQPVMDILRIILAILLPPLGVFLQVGIGPQFWINILLTLLGYIPGIIHALWVILKYK